MNPRKTAVQLLCRTEQEHSYSNLLLDAALSQSQMEQRDRRLCTTLYYGTIKRRITLDAVLAKYSRQPLEKLDVTVRNILRTGVYQLLYCDQIPNSAAVNESVRLTRCMKKASAAGFVNAVLRGFLRDDCQIPYPADKTAAMAVAYAVPQWLLERLLSAYGTEKTAAFLSDALKPAPRYIRRNALRCTRAQLEQTLGDAAVAMALPEDAYRLTAGDIRRLDAFQQGWFYVQDVSSQLCALLLDAQPGETVLDLCAAPGGKTCTIALTMQDQGCVRAFDAASHRVGLIEEKLQRLGLTCVTAAQGDATVYTPALAGADRVLCDVPCSGIGVLRRKPEIKEKTPEELAALPQLQLQILENGARYVRPGGILQYSTCTVLPEENEQVVAQFLAHHPAFAPEPLMPSMGSPFDASMVTMLPEMFGGDGFFVAKLRRVQ